jgi:hypothetical protein
MHYDNFKRNIYSQNGEDGVIAKLIEELNLKIDDMWLVDVGAYDGISYSNFRTLIEQGSNAVLIEPCLVGGSCEEKYSKLQHMPKQFPKVKVLNHFTKISDIEKSNGGWNACKFSHETLCNNFNFNPPQKTLDESLAEIGIVPKDYDILNIDIDSYDHEVWKEHTYSPKIVIIEINSGLEPSISALKNHEGGCSFSGSLDIAKQKGYSCVCHTGNMIYVRNDLLNRLSIPNHSINSISLFNRAWLKK